MTIDWGAPVAWVKRSEEFGALSTFDDGRLIIAMEYSPNVGRWDELRELWMELSPHPHLLDPLEAFGDDGLLLRYAAIHWGRPRLHGLGTAFARRTLAGWIHQLAGVYRHIAAEVEPKDLHRIACPLVKIDVGDAVRVGFWPVPAGHVAAPEVDRRMPKWDERTLVYIVGRTLQTMVDHELVASSPLGLVVGTCVEEKPAKRYQTLAAVQDAARAVVPHVAVRDRRERDLWAYVEEGMGWLALGDPMRAQERFVLALSSEYSDIAQWGVDRSQEGLRTEHLRADLEGEWVMKARTKPPRSQVVVERYDRERFLVRARDSARSGDPAHAFELAERVLLDNPDDVDALAVTTDVLLRVRNYIQALEYADRLVTRAGDVGRHHYRRGKALFGVGRLVEARAVFELALSLDPKLVEAMLLHCEVERTMRNTRIEVGTQRAPVIELPESLAPFRSVILAGRPRAIIDALSVPEQAENLDAQVMLARYLALDGEPDRASAIFERVASAPFPYRQRALVGKAELLLDAGAHESALALFDVVCAEAPSDLDASEGRAQALERLGRVGEAAAEYRRFVGLANARADLRVRAAQQWLDAHAL